ncbi:MAG: GtrA family protein [Alloprevotella sp.]|nr:GtrA family protein [Alloprevotella sp.]
MKSNLRKETSILVKYAMVGIVNTCVTALVFFLLRWACVQEDLANLLSYIAGLLNSFVMNKLFVFCDRKNGWLDQGAVFFLGAAICWLLQWGAFRALLTCMPEAWAYLLAMVLYNVLYYIYNRIITFRK